ncbi:MAG TPA: hypothetical protein GXZ82_03810 [Firmicutes bacterium]|jgi:hypothetical protein|nr:hypothetical protein [Bacillota bacterium]
MRINAMRPAVVVAVIILFTLVFAPASGLAADQVLEITAAANSYAHLYKPFPDVPGSVVTAELSIKVGDNSGSSWAPSLWFYWGPEAFVGIGQQPDMRIRVNQFGLIAGATAQPLFRAYDWTDVQIVVTPQLIQVMSRPQGGDWILIYQSARTEGFVGMPKEIIIGKGFSNNTEVYPNPHLDNSTAAVAPTGVSYVDNLIVTVDGKTVLTENFASLEGWGIHQDPDGNVEIRLVTPEEADAAFKEL